MSLASNLSSWSILTAENDDGILIVRLRIEKPAIASIDTYQTSVIVKWDYIPESAAGMPPEKTKHEMDLFEREIGELTAENDNSYLMVVATGMGIREWHFYVKEYDIFIKRFNGLLKKAKEFPIDIEYYHDPEWNNWRDFVKLNEHDTTA